MRIAAIDLGTNSFHLLIVETRPDGSFVPLVREKEMLRLGDDVAREGRIARDASRRVLATLRRFRALADNAGAERIVACATSAFREAANGARLVEAIGAETGLCVRIIGGEEEAALIYSAMRASVHFDRVPALGFDLGGGSLEVMVGDAADLWWAASLPLGVARLTAELVRHDPPTGGDLRRLSKRFTARLGPVSAEVARRFGTGEDGPRLVVASGGTFCDLARMLAYRRTGGLPISVNQLTLVRHELADLHEQLWQSTAAERRRLPGLEARRADLVPVGSMLLLSAMELFGFDELTVSEWALREGIVLEAARAVRPGFDGGPRDIRRASVVALARRYNWDESHGRAVARLALTLFDGTRALHHLGCGERELLEYAALLHDIGEHVSMLAHHKHTSYLIQHGRLRGFCPEEVLALAALARYGSRGEPKAAHKPFGDLDGKTRARVVKLAALLRLAASLDRGRNQVVGSVTVDSAGPVTRLRLQSSGNCELELWAAQRQSRMFEKVYGRRLELVATGSWAPAACGILSEAGEGGGALGVA